jgi:hypothetical protein
MSPNEVIRQFDAKHGNTGIIIGQYPGVFYYADGSKRENNPYGYLADADEFSPQDRTRNQLRYHQELLRRARNKFDDMKQELHTQAKAAQRGQCNPPSQDDLAKLRELQRAVKQAQKGVNDAQAALTKLMPGQGQVFHSTAADDVLRQLDRIEV